MKQCFDCGNKVKLDLKPGEVYKYVGHGLVSSRSRYYLVTHTTGELALHSLDNGNIYSSNSIFGGNDEEFVKVNCCFKVEGE